MPSCAYCKNEGRADARFCEQCGAPLPREGAPAAAAPSYGASSSVAWTPWCDPTEGAFALDIPQGWSARGGIQRGGPYGLPQAVFQAADPSGRIGFVLAPEHHQFSQPVMGGGGMMGALMGMFGGMDMSALMGPQAPPLPYQDAVSLARGHLLGQWRRQWPDVAIVQSTLNPAETARHLQRMQRECAQRGMMVNVEGSVADLLLQYTAGGVPMLHGARVSTTRMSDPYGMTPMPWYAEVSGAWYAPADRFATWEPVLHRIAASLRFDPRWEGAQLASDNARAGAMQADTQRRQQQISQTLSQTSDIVASSYWSSQQIHQQHEQGRAAAAAAYDDWQHRYSNATLGWEDRVDDSGRRFSIEAGHDRVWRDDAGALHYGNQLTNPDPRWHELKPL